MAWRTRIRADSSDFTSRTSVVSVARFRWCGIVCAATSTRCSRHSMSSGSGGCQWSAVWCLGDVEADIFRRSTCQRARSFEFVARSAPHIGAGCDICGSDALRALACRSTRRRLQPLQRATSMDRRRPSCGHRGCQDLARGGRTVGAPRRVRRLQVEGSRGTAWSRLQAPGRPADCLGQLPNPA
jgi:hypothetical protein